MAALAGIWNQHEAAGRAHLSEGAKPMAGPGSGSGGTDPTGSSGSDSASITANDFLTLLVTEMQNQDPTAATDPNEYINQLVQVNSLQQLISINQNLSTALGISPTAPASDSAASRATGMDSGSVVHGHGPGPLGAGKPTVEAAGPGKAAQSHAVKHASGNLTVPEVKPAAQRVAQALNGRPHAH